MLVSQCPGRLGPDLPAHTRNPGRNLLHIGRHPAAKVMENLDEFRPASTPGRVTIGLGENLLLGRGYGVKGAGGLTFLIVSNHSFV